MRPLWHADPHFHVSNSLGTEAFKRASKNLLDINRSRGALFNEQWADHYYSKLYVPTGSKPTVPHSDLATQAENSWFTAREGVNFVAQASQERSVFVFASSGDFAASMGGDANAPASPSKIQREDDAGEGEKKKKKNKSRQLHESGQLLHCLRNKIALTQAQAVFLHQVQGIHWYIYIGCVCAVE